ncbi:MAG: hypothetical protein U9O87_00820 [Verrucomicrobiota bacterium]|nr:hypothetical protein [Verrucomicrobiota bacterium]
MNKDEVVEAYRGLQKIEQVFRNMKTIVLELRPIHHKLDNRIRGHIFIIMFAYYLQWHAMKRVEPLFLSDGKGSNRRWSFDIIMQRLKSIDKVENIINNVVIKKTINKPDDEQSEILKLLGVKL